MFWQHHENVVVGKLTARRTFSLWFLLQHMKTLFFGRTGWKIYVVNPVPRLSYFPSSVVLADGFSQVRGFS